LTDAGALTGADYELEWQGAAWSLRRLDSGAAVPFTGTGTAGSPIVFDGLSLLVGGTPAVGDRVLLRPTREAVSQMRVEITAPSRVAAATPVRVSASIDNLGAARVSSLEVIDASDPMLRTPVAVTFPTPSTLMSCTEQSPKPENSRKLQLPPENFPNSHRYCWAPPL
jgi:flagellar hook-associated protein 1 FlgK